MKVDLMEPAAVQRNWPWLTQLLAPSFDASIPTDKIRDMLLGGALTLFTVHLPGCAGVVVLHPVATEHGTRLWVAYMAGRIKGGRRQFLRTIREIMAHIVAVARLSGCAEVCIGGRNYSRIFRDFERFGDDPNWLRKEL